MTAGVGHMTQGLTVLTVVNSTLYIVRSRILASVSC